MSNPDNHLYEFGSFRLDPIQRSLLRAEEQVRLPPMVFDLLLFLVERSGQLVKKDEIINHLWPDSYVEEGNLTNNISILRKELGDNGKDPKYVETVPKHGYRFVASVKVLNGGETKTPHRMTTRFKVLLIASVFASLVLVVAFYLWRGRNQARYTEHTGAYQAYMRGRYFWGKRDEENLKKAIDEFKQALTLDNKYAPAYAGLADCYNVLPSYGSLSPVEAYPRARDAATKALEIDGTIAEAHVALGRVKANYDWDWPGAEAEFKRAIELNPNYSSAHYFYALNYLVPMGKLDEAAAELRRALELDQFSLITNTNLGVIFYYQGRYDEAIAQYRKALELDQRFTTAHLRLIDVYTQTGKFDEALAEHELIVQPRGSENPTYLEQLKEALRQSGPQGYWRKRLEQAQEKIKQTAEYVPPTSVAGFAARLGDNDQAFEWLEKAYETRDDGLTRLKLDPRYQNLRADPRYVDLLRRINLGP
jgi:DNA-binding winged helix-turn-helix (wHTH) protein/tetratricopeptide (TPR) repeat protein